MTTFFLKALLLVSFTAMISCKTFSRCDLAKLLVKNSISKGQFGDWVCLAEHESNLKTDALNTQNWDGSYDYGIFQINSRYWCQGPNTQSNGCNIECSALLDENLSDDVSCAKKIHSMMGFPAWVAWKNKCQGRDVNYYINGCNL